MTQGKYEKTTQTKLRVLNKVWDVNGKVIILRIIYKVDELVGFNSLGEKLYRPKKKEQVFYGLCKKECLDKMERMMVDQPYYVKKHRVSGYVLHGTL